MFNIFNKERDKHFWLGAVAIMGAALLWSLDGVFIRPKFYVLPATLVVFWEHALGLIILSPFIFLSWRKLKELSLKSWVALGWVALFGGAIGTIFITKAFFAAMDGEVTFATVVILQKLQPIFALLLARVILKEKLTGKFYLWAGVAIAAAYGLAFGKQGLNLAEIDWWHNAAIFAFIAAFAFGSSTVFGKRIVNQLDFKLTAALRFALTSIIMFALIIINGEIGKLGEISAGQWGLLALIVFTSGAGAMFLYYFGLKRVTASTATICELFWPFSAVILDYLLNKNILNGIQIAAAVILLVAFYKVVNEGRQPELSFTAKVIAGLKRGRRLGWPTANLDKIDLALAHGVYAVEITVAGKTYSAVMHFGPKKTFNEGISNEILIKDFAGNIYGQEVQVKILRKIRRIKKFKNIEELTKRIKEDLKLV